MTAGTNGRLTARSSGRLAAMVINDLGGRIVRGDLAAGSAIDVDALETEFGVSRTVVREAVKVLSSKGLVGARPKVGTYVRPRSDWNQLDPDVLGWRGSGQPDLALFRDLSELRAAVEPAACALAAQRRTDADLTELHDALADLRSADVQRHVQADTRFHRAILRATRNELFSSLDAILENALRIRDQLVFPQRGSDRFVDLHAAVLTAIESRRPTRARNAMIKLLAAADEDAAATTGADPDRTTPTDRVG